MDDHIQDYSHCRSDKYYSLIGCEAWERMMTWALEVPRDTAGKEDQVEFIKQVYARRPELDANIPRWVLDN